MIQPPYLKIGDKVAITCPAKKLLQPMTDAVALLESWGLKVVLGETVNASYNQFAGEDALRAADLQGFIKDDSIKAIFAARGGYGTIRMIDDVDFSSIKEAPKWIIGFSDITVLHAHVFAAFGLQSIHGQMPLTIPDGTAESLQTLRKALFGEDVGYQFSAEKLNRMGEAQGILVGGNLALLIAVSGSVSDFVYSGKILFIEDVGEYLYSIDRMMRTLKRAGKLKNLAGLMVGSFTELKDNETPFGQTAEEIIFETVKEYDYPVCFNFPAGHISNNQALILGKTLNLTVQKEHTTAKYL
ncbi:S66 peptidase family protein [Mucilaginibacter arboris]|uniref:LD-carboxypeptidase n=1 Tax=Mucilaginibacter arboris TaxID=2682090 RepID=A0A7K1SSD0_9SPHI|nr:LD-carboxypeptidase [Mucilaginibacter arboris]MVN20215.1 LD-carboxypeptidase [Mucilaginibacter arboris]